MPINVQLKGRIGRDNKSRPYWYFYWLSQEGRPRWKTTRFPVVEYPDLTAKKAAIIERARAEFQTRLNDGFEPGKVPVGNMKFSEVIEKYLDDPVMKIREKPSFARNIKQKLDLLKMVFGNYEMRRMTEKEVSEWFNARRKLVKDGRGREVCVNSWNLLEYKGHLDRIFRWAKKKSFAKNNPILEILDKNPNFFPTPPRRQIVTVTDEEISAMLDAMDQLEERQKRILVHPNRIPVALFRDVFLFRLYQGTRVQEALDIQINDISRKEVKNRENQVVGYRYFVFIKPGKTGEGRTIPLLKMVEGVIWRNMQNKGPEDFLFSVAGKHLKTCNMRRLFGKTIALVSQIMPSMKAKGLRFYDLRHLCLTRMALQRVGDRILGNFAGHRSRKSTDYYVNFADNDLVGAIELVEQSYGSERMFATALPQGLEDSKSIRKA
jgi:integrase